MHDTCPPGYAQPDGAEPDFPSGQVVSDPCGALANEIGFSSADLTVRTARRHDGMVAIRLHDTTQGALSPHGNPTRVLDEHPADYHRAVRAATETAREATAPLAE